MLRCSIGEDLLVAVPLGWDRPARLDLVTQLVCHRHGHLVGFGWVSPMRNRSRETDAYCEKKASSTSAYAKPMLTILLRRPTVDRPRCSTGVDEMDQRRSASTPAVTPTGYSRRDFLRYSGGAALLAATGGVLAGCGSTKAGTTRPPRQRVSRQAEAGRPADRRPHGRRLVGHRRRAEGRQQRRLLPHRQPVRRSRHLGPQRQAGVCRSPSRSSRTPTPRCGRSSSGPASSSTTGSPSPLPTSSTATSAS